MFSTNNSKLLEKSTPPLTASLKTMLWLVRATLHDILYLAIIKVAVEFYRVRHIFPALVAGCKI